MVADGVGDFLWQRGERSTHPRRACGASRPSLEREGLSDARQIAARETLDQIQKDAIKWSPVVNTYTRPANLTSELV